MNEWFGVLVVRHDQSDAMFEESVTVCRAASADAAIELAGASASKGEDGSFGRRWIYANAYRIAEIYNPLSVGTEVFSQLRDSTLGHSRYISRFYAGFNERLVGLDVLADYRTKRRPTLSSWYGARAVFAWGSGSTYEDRITIWRARSASNARRLARREAARYAREILGGQLLEVVDVYRITGKPTDGSRVFAARRTWDFPAELYVERFHQTGGEHQSTV